ncbi:conserved hypothetical protein, partial [Listeria innocua FSL J1-023]
FKSYVSTFGELIRIRFSPGNSSFRPPFIKNVTCGYFSVSAIRSCDKPSLESTSPITFFISIGSKATSASILGL